MSVVKIRYRVERFYLNHGWEPGCLEYLNRAQAITASKSPHETQSTRIVKTTERITRTVVQGSQIHRKPKKPQP